MNFYMQRKEVNEMEQTMPDVAKLYASVEPTEAQRERFMKFLEGRYGRVLSLEWVEDHTLDDGFILEVGEDVYDWTPQQHYHQFERALSRIDTEEAQIVPLIQKTLDSWQPEIEANQLGIVNAIGDGIARVSGLADVAFGEILIFSDGVKGMVQSLNEHEVGCILFGDETAIVEGSTVKRTGQTAAIPVGEGFLGRVVNALGEPIDGGEAIASKKLHAIEYPAPSILDRQPVNAPMETGILAIDAMFPIGRGQRELIIGDRQTGKTAIALDAIINQRGKDIVCIYVSIGQKSSSIAQMVEQLKRMDAMAYTIVIHASASDSAPMQYIAPYSGAALGEYFMQNGRDVLIVYDDLSKHAIAYRTLSLLLGRPPGREAYPGDVFYLHSRLLERSAHLSDALGGGSMTALPIVETQAGDVSAYIPTNIISITDGQIFLESNLFNSGQRPAVNVGLSVSRVGGDAQTKAVKKAVGTLRLDLAQYREMEVFTQFSSDLDEQTKRQLNYGKTLMAVLKQHQFRPYTQAEKIVILTAGLNHLLDELPAEEIGTFLEGMIAFFEDEDSRFVKHLNSVQALSEDDRCAIIERVRLCVSAYLGR